MKGRDLHYNKSRFYHERPRYSWWQVEIFMMILGWLNSGVLGKYLIIQFWWGASRQFSHMSLPYLSSE